MDQSKHDAGMAVRRSVLGGAYVDGSRKAPGQFGAALQELITENVWGTVWVREGLDRKTRSLLNIAMMAAINHAGELRLHVEGAVNNGCTPQEIEEVLLQVAAYCGAPAALSAFHVADAVLEELEG